MKGKMNTGWMISVLLMCFVTVSFGQVENKNSIGELVYQEYSENGIDEALKKYHQTKTNEKDLYIWNEWELNNIGYKIMIEDQDLDAADKIFKLNMKEYPAAANPQDSYGDFLLEAGQPEEAKKYFQKAIDIAEKSSIEEEKTRILNGSKAKLAKLENKHRQLEFLVGDWEMESIWFTEGHEGVKTKSFSTISYLPGESILNIDHSNGPNKPCCQRSMVYNAPEDEYHMVYMNAGEPRGIEISTMKVKNLGNNKYELFESYVDNDGILKAAKHEMVKNMDNSIQWTIYEPTDNNQWDKVNQMTFRKKM